MFQTTNQITIRLKLQTYPYIISDTVSDLFGKQGHGSAFYSEGNPDLLGFPHGGQLVYKVP